MYVIFTNLHFLLFMECFVLATEHVFIFTNIYLLGRVSFLTFVSYPTKVAINKCAAYAHQQQDGGTALPLSTG